MAASQAPVFQVYRIAGADGAWWRVVSPNGRALARAPHEFPDVNQALEHIAMVKENRLRMKASVRVMPSHRWRWQLLLDGVVIVTGSGEQDRRVRCDAAWKAFVELAENAPIDPTVHAFRRGYPLPAAT